MPVGFTKVRTGYEPPELSRPALEIERIYVMAAHQGKAIGNALLEHNLSYARGQGYAVIWLGVWEHNLAAIRLYERWGFTKFGSHIFLLGRDPQTDLLFSKDL
jgi:ribosomal protein S18 acetylase RimI-like enzyme